MTDYFHALSAAAEAQARLAVLSSFLEYWNGAPTRGMVATWLEDKARIFNEETQSWKTEKAALFSREPSAENILPASDLTLKYGTLVGMGDEVLRLSRETEVFLAELDDAAQADALAWQRFGAGLQQMGQAMQSAGDRQQDKEVRASR